MIWFRMLWILLTARFRPPIPIMAEHELNFRCLPTDLDLNRHLTNSRFHSFMDQVRFDLMLRSGIWRRLRATDTWPVLGSSAIRFRRSVRPWQRFQVTVRIVTWDERWIYMAHRLTADGETSAVAIVKTALADKAGRIPAERFADLMSHAGPRPPLSELAAAQNILDKLLMSESAPDSRKAQVAR
jgi:acyl-CoA thioesterase FadM